MKKLIAGIVLLLLFQSVSSQNTYLDYKFAVKFYNMTTYADYSKSVSDSNSYPYPYRYTDTRLRILHPTLAFQWKSKKNNFHEVELTDFMLGITGKEIDTASNGRPIYTDELITTSISARYEFILNFNKLKNTKFVPSLGFAINPYFDQFRYLPGAQNEYLLSEKHIGAKVFVTPRITYYLSPKVFFDMNVPICILDSYYQSYKDENPTLPIKEQKTNTLNFEAFPKVFSVRIGVGLKF